MAIIPRGRLTKIASMPIKGPSGRDGLQGPIGRQGVGGDRGLQGISGPPGPSGPQGVRGERGFTGSQGPTGSQGERGLQGEKGDDGQIPAHKWVGNKLHFKNPDGTWDNGRDLTGPRGLPGTTNRTGGSGGGASVLDVITELIAGGYVDGIYAKNIDFENKGDIIYIGEADPGSDTSSNVWRIKKLVVTNNQGDTITTWADGNADFDNVWDDHLTLTYI